MGYLRRVRTAYFTQITFNAATWSIFSALWDPSLFLPIYPTQPTTLKKKHIFHLNHGTIRPLTLEALISIYRSKQ